MVAAVESLYEDQIKPVSRILRKRLTERMQLRAQEVNDQALSTECQVAAFDGDFLRAMCLRSPQLVVEREDACDWAVALTARQPTFIDVYKQEDPYPEELWAEFASFCSGDSGKSLSLPGGRYSCALSLQAQGLPFLQDRSLGEINHIVQLALTQRKLLGYSNGSIVPYSRSQSMLKEECAKSHCPCSSTSSPMLAANWDVARGCLWQILQSSPGGQLALPNVKRLFRSRFHMELSETAFGYSKVSELLQDPRFQDLCHVELRGQGYVVIQKKVATDASVISLENSLNAAPQANQPIIDVAPRRVELSEPLLPKEATLDRDMPVSLVQTPTSTVGGQTPSSAGWILSPGMCLTLSQDGYKDIVQNTFIQVKRPSETPRMPTSRSMPDLLFCHDSRYEDQREEPSDDTSGSEEEPGSEASGSNNPLADLLGALHEGDLEVGGSTSLEGASTRTPRGARSGRSALRTPGNAKPSRRVNFCLDEPLPLDDPSPVVEAQLPAQVFPMTPCTPIEESEELAGLKMLIRFSRQSDEERSQDTSTSCDGSLGLSDFAEPRPKHGPETTPLPTLMTPRDFTKEGFVVSNTFIQSKLIPPTPFRQQESRRSKSVGA